ncbi:MAG: glycosyltransferase, partial [Proteobacteria bacterium]|nr:glycosyltransferase [Pseudomonadota bacterium]
MERLLASLVDQTERPQRILVVDNAPGSSATKDMISERYAEAVTYVREPVAGLDFARNRALCESDSDIVAFIDDDAVAVMDEPTTLAEAIEVEADSEAGIAVEFEKSSDEITSIDARLEATADKAAAIIPIEERLEAEPAGAVADESPPEPAPAAPVAPRRLGLIGPKVTAEQAHDLLEPLVAPEEVYAFHVGLITHGRQVCRAQRPKCLECIVASG